MLSRQCRFSQNSGISAIQKVKWRLARRLVLLGSIRKQQLRKILVKICPENVHTLSDYGLQCTIKVLDQTIGLGMISSCVKLLHPHNLRDLSH